MTGQKRTARRFAIVALLAVSAAAAALLPVTGWLEPLDPQAPGQCVRLAGPLGAEDFAADWSQRRAYVSSADRHAVNTGGRPKGDIYLLDFSGTEPQLTPLNIWPDDSFFPHGLDLYIGPDGTKRLFAVNHGVDGKQHSIEVFEPKPDGTLTHIQTIDSSAFTSPNDVAATGPDSFYVSNDPFTDPVWRRLAVTYMLMPLNTIAYYDGKRARVVAEDLQFGNGLALSPDGQWLLAAESVGRSVHLYRRNMFNGALTKTGEIGLPMAADNLIVQPDGTVVVAGHPRPLAFQVYAQSPKDRAAPSLVMAVPAAELPFAVPSKPAAPLPYINLGAEFSASSVGMYAADRLFVGSVYERGILMCMTQNR